MIQLKYNLSQSHKEIRDLPEIQEEGVLNITTDYSQLDYYVDGDTIQGFQYELSQAISELSGLEVRINLEMNLEKSFEDLDNNRCDIIARNLPKTQALADKYLFTEPIILNKQVLVQRVKDEGEKDVIRNQLHLAGKTVHIPKNSPARVRLENLSTEIGDSIVIVEDELYSEEQLAAMVASGDIDYTVCDKHTAAACKKLLPELDINTDVSFTQLQSWAIRKDSPILLDSLNSWLNKIKESGLYDKIYRKYYK
jgi:membrane-bound lytic murein transglycosylase MltF